MKAIHYFLSLLLVLIIAINVLTVVLDQQGMHPDLSVILLLDFILFPIAFGVHIAWIDDPDEYTPIILPNHLATPQAWDEYYSKLAPDTDYSKSVPTRTDTNCTY